MITRSTVLVLGAGASKDYDYQLGRELKEEVVSWTAQENNDTYRVLTELGHKRSEIKEFSDALRLSGQPSVDAFLEHRTKLKEIGKRAIAAALLRRENEALIFSREESWYQHLYENMSAPFDDFARNALSVVTFNYDRSLEVFLLRALQNSHEKSEAEVAKALKSIPIIHVHGSLGPLPWQEAGGREYKHSIDPEDVRNAASTIRIISELQEEDEAFEEARSLLSESERVIFLGFHYHKENVARLRLELASGVFRLFGSAFHRTDLEMHEINNMFKPAIIELGHRGDKTLQYLRENISF